MILPFRYNISTIRLYWEQESSDGLLHSIDRSEYVAELQINLNEENNLNQVGLFFLFKVV